MFVIGFVSFNNTFSLSLTSRGKNSGAPLVFFPFKNYIRNTAPPRVVFVIGCVSCNKFSHFRGNERKKSANTLEVCGERRACAV